MANIGIVGDGAGEDNQPARLIASFGFPPIVPLVLFVPGSFGGISVPLLVKCVCVCGWGGIWSCGRGMCAGGTQADTRHNENGHNVCVFTHCSWHFWRGMDRTAKMAEFVGVVRSVNFFFLFPNKKARRFHPYIHIRLPFCIFVIIGLFGCRPQFEHLFAQPDAARETAPPVSPLTIVVSNG